MEATWNHGKNHGSHGTKARILATGVIRKTYTDLRFK